MREGKWIKKELKRTELNGKTLGLVGIGLISSPSIDEGASQASGVAMVVAATFCYGIALNLGAPLQHKYGAVRVMSWVLTVAAVLTVPYGLVDLGSNEAQLGPIVAVLILGVVGTGVAFALMGSLVNI